MTMRKTIVLALAAAALAAAPATAQVVKDKATCEQAVKDAKEGLATASVGAKSYKEAEDMVRISEHLCTQANFVYAERLLEIVRGMTASE